MSPERQTTIEGNKVEEYYWAGKYVVHVDNCATDESYDEAIKRLSALEWRGCYEN